MYYDDQLYASPYELAFSILMSYLCLMVHQHQTELMSGGDLVIITKNTVVLFYMRHSTYTCHNKYCIVWIVSPGAYFRKGVFVKGLLH